MNGPGVPEQAAEPTSPFRDKLELALKVGTLGLGVLYVLGLLISNLQLMEVGISDFTSLQARNVMTGLVFVLYAGLLAMCVSGVAVGLVYLGATLVSSSLGKVAKVLRCLGIVLSAVVMTLVLLILAGSLLGHFSPWGQPWVDSFRIDWTSWDAYKKQYKDTFVRGLAQFQDAYWHPYSILPAGVLLVLEMQTLAGLRREAVELGARSILLPRVLRAWYASSAAGFFVFVIYLLVIGVPPLMVGFAREAYPNIRYNLGGGQPDVARVQVSLDKAASLSLPGLGAPGSVARPDDVATTDPVVIWYQSDKFLYLAPLSTAAQGDARLVALDLRTVRSIHYLPQSVRIGAGSRVLSVHSE